ncbi:MAG: hypothetical protein JNL69_06115, partial [Bacteroidia bacterium]|nr:hypothetical protein [Bacteroidia bacterium]
MKTYFHILFLLLAIQLKATIGPKIVNATRIALSPKIDGNLDDEAWKSAEIASDFIQRSPTPGINSSKKTEVKIIYDDIAIYIGAMMYDEHPDSILRELTTRDNEANADMFGLIIDTYNDDLNGYGFFVS